MSQEKSPRSMRIAEIILGAIAIGASAVVLSYPGITTFLTVILLSISLLVVGISSIITGAVIRALPKGTRAIKIGMGIVAIIGSFVSMANPEAVLLAFVMLIAIFVLIYGAGLIATGAAGRGQSKPSRIASVVIGVIVVSMSAVLFAFPEFALALVLIILSLTLLLNGIASIISGITGRVRVV